MAILEQQLGYRNNALTSAPTRVQRVLKMYSTLLIVNFSKCNLFKYVYKIINKMYFILYQVLLFYFISSCYTAVLCVSKVSFLGEIDKELTF